MSDKTPIKSNDNSPWSKNKNISATKNQAVKPKAPLKRNLSKNAQKFLRGISHDTKPLVTVADKGLTENVMLEIEVCLDQHELVKVKLRTDRDTRVSHTEEIITATGAQKIQSIGQTLTIYRANQKKPVYELPR